MRRIGWFLVALTTGAGLALTAGQQAAAMTGCCKERASSAAEFGPPNRLTFEQCKARNQARDDDNVFDQLGLVWWDVRG